MSSQGGGERRLRPVTRERWSREKQEGGYENVRLLSSCQHVKSEIGMHAQWSVW